MKKLTDKKLVAEFLKGNDRTFEKLLKRHLESVYNFLYQLTKDRSAVDDLAQETFIKVWKNLRRFDQSRNFKTWLFAIAKNTAYDFLKKKKAVPFSFFEDGEGNNQINNLPDKNLAPDQILENADLAKDLEQKLQKISPRYRIILLLRYKDDFSLAEIAEILDKPYNTIKSQHNRGLNLLKKLFPKQKKTKTASKEAQGSY